jgi:hypothetical protein
LIEQPAVLEVCGRGCRLVATELSTLRLPTSTKWTPKEVNAVSHDELNLDH